MTGLKLFLLGLPRVELNGMPVDIQRRKAMAMLVYLAVSGQAHSRDTLATFFWPDLDQQRARAYLRRDLAALNTSLPGNWLIADRETVELNREAGPWLDSEQFQRLLTASQKHSHAPEIVCPDCIPPLTEAAALYTDDFLAGFTLRDSPEFDDWQFFQTESLRQELATALERLVRGLKTQGQADAAIPHARRWVALDPLHEPAQRRLIQVYDQAGQPAAALRQYEEYVRLLEEELGLPPEEETTTLYEAIKAKRIFAPFIKAEEHKRSSQRRRSDQPAPESPTAPGEPALPVVSPGPAGLSSPEVPASSAVAVTHPVGREAELGQLAACLKQALAGSRQMVFITGEAGLGKTTLVETFLEEARHKATFWIGQGQCIEHRGAGEAYMPVLEALGRMCREAEGHALIALLTKAAPTWLVQMPWLVGPEDFETLQDRVLGTTRERMLRELVEAVEMLTAERPLILVLEDLQWSDYSTLDLLTRLAVRQEPARLLLIGTYRPADVKMQDHPLRAVVQDIQLRGQGMELSLPLLTETMVESYLGLRFPGANFLAELAHLLHQRTDGNPLFIRTLSDTWVAQGLLAEVEGRWMLKAKLEDLMAGVPDTLRLLIEQQFRQLNSVEQTILEVASVAGMEFSIATLMTGVDMTEEELERRCVALAQLGPFCQASGIVEWPDGTVTAQFRFSHSLYQEVMYQRVPAGRKVHLHRQIGRRLEIGYGAKAAAHAAELGLHFVQGRDPGRAVTYLQYAAEQAAQRNAYREAIEHLTQALEFLQRYPDLPEHSAYELGLQAALGPALILTRGWATPEAEQAFVRAKELSRRLEDIGQLSSVLYGLAVLSELRGQYAHSQALMEERLQLPHDPEDYTLQVESYEVLACSTFHQGAFTQAVTHANQALIFGNPPNNSLMTLLGKNTAVASQYWGGLALWFLGYPDQAVVRSQQALKQVQSFSYTFSLAYAREQEAMLYQLQREATVVYQQAEAAITAAIQGGFSYWLGVGQIFRGWALVVRGQAERGMGQLRQGLDICQATGATIDQPYFLAMLADACGRTGRPEEGVAALAEALTLARQSPAFFYEAELHRLKGELLLQLEPEKNMASAEACFQQALDIARHQQAKSLELRAAMSLSRLWQKQGQGDQARSMLAEVYNWFSEGFDTTDLQEAKTLLEELGGEVKPSSNRGRAEEKASPLPLLRPDLKQQVRYCRTSDGVRLAYAIVGHGPPLVKAANWLSHLEYDWQSPVWRHWLEGLAGHHTLVRYDKRGCGLSDWEVNDFSLRAQVDDLETVVDALGLKRFPLLGLSGGGPVALAYAVRHPEKVSHLILYGSYVRGRLKRSENLEQFEEVQMMLKMMELGWGKANPAFRQVYTSLFIPEGTAEQVHWFNELQRISTAPEIAVRMATASYSVDVSDLAPQVTVPTLVLYVRDDAIVAFEQSRQLATLIPGVRFVPLEGKNHILLEHEPAWSQFLNEVYQFLGVEPEGQSGPPALPKWQPAHSPTPTPTSPPVPLFVARQQELAQLDAFLEAALTGQSRVVFVTGEAGQGKSALLQAFARRAQRAHPDLIVAGGTCNAYTGIGDPYLPFREILELLTGASEVQTAAETLLGEQVERLRPLLPRNVQTLVDEGADLLDTFVPAKALLSRATAFAPRGAAWLAELQALVNRKLKQPDGAAVQQAALFEQYTRVIQALSRQTPLLLLLDDLQWADTGSTNLLFHLGRRLAGHHVLIVGAYRPADVAMGRDGERHPLEFVVNEFQRHFGDTSLNLAQAEGEAFVNALLDSEPNQLSDTFRVALFQLTAGHPLFTIELLRGMQERGDLVKDETGRWVEQSPLDWTTLPPRVEGAIGARIKRLEAALQNLLRIASVEGETFTAEVVAQVLQIDARTVIHQFSQVLDRVHHLVRVEGLKHDGELRLSRYQFRHILIQRYLYQSLDEIERAHHHEAVGQALEILYDQRTDQIAVQLAHHYNAANIPEQARVYLHQAGDQARHSAALAEASRYYQAVLVLWPETAQAERAGLLRKLGECQWVLGQLQDALTSLKACYSLNQALNNQQEAGIIQLLIGRLYWEQGNREESLRYHHQALAILEERPESVELARAFSAISQLHMLAAEYDQATAWGEQALDLANRLGADAVKAHSMLNLGITRFYTGEQERGLSLLRDSLQLALSLGLPHDACRAYLVLGECLASDGRYLEAQATFTESESYATQVGASLFAGSAVVENARILWVTGKWQAALSNYQKILDWTRQGQSLGYLQVLAGNLFGHIYNDLGQAAKTWQVLQEILSQAQGQNELQAMGPHLAQSARALDELGRKAEARTQLHQLLTLIKRHQYDHLNSIMPLLFSCHWFAAQAAIGDESLDDAKTSLQLLERLFNQTTSSVAKVALEEARGVVALTEGNYKEAILHYRNASGGWQKLGCPYDQARVLHGLAQTLRSTNDTAQARAAVAQGLEIIETLAGELEDAGTKAAFLNSALVQQMDQVGFTLGISPVAAQTDSSNEF